MDLAACRALVDDADRDPTGVVERTSQMLEGIDPDQALTPEQAVCAWAFGLAARHLRQLDRAYLWLERAASALPIGSADHTGVELSRSSTLVYQGDLDQAVQVLEATRPDESLAPRVTCQLATVHEFRGDLTLAQAGYQDAIDGFLHNGDAKGEAHALAGLAMVNVARGEIVDAVHKFRLAQSIYVGLGDDVLAAVMQSNVGWAAAQGGDFVTALDHLAIAQQHLKASGGPFAETALEHALVLLKAGLPGEAVQVISQVLPQLEAAGADTDRAEVLLTFGQALAGYGYPADATRCFTVARSLFEQQGRSLWVQLSDLRLLEVQAATSTDPTLDHSAACRRGLALADSLEREESSATIDALVVAARYAHRARDLTTLRQINERLAAAEPSDHALLGACLQLEIEDQPLVMLQRIFEHIDQRPTDHGGLSLDLQAGLALRSDELLQIGLRAAMRANDPHSLARIVLAAKNPLLAHPQVLPDHDDLGDDLRRALRQDLDASGWREISERVRTTERRAPATGPATIAVSPITRAIVIAAIGGDIIAVRMNGRSAETIGTHNGSDVKQAFQRHQFLLETAVLDPGNHLAGALRASTESLQKLLPWLEEDDLDLVPAGELSSAPWTSVASGPVRIVVEPHPTKRAATADGHLVAIGPDTASAQHEAMLVGQQPQMAVEHATAAAVIAIAAELDVLHLACHADHNSENPLLSSYLLHDGRLRGYEIERLGGAPRIVISSACNAGKQELRGQGQMLGLPATWLAAGAEAVIAPSCPIPDDVRTAETMADIHRRISAGVKPEQAVFDARETADELVARTLVTFGRRAESPLASN